MTELLYYLREITTTGLAAMSLSLELQIQDLYTRKSMGVFF